MVRLYPWGDIFNLSFFRYIYGLMAVGLARRWGYLFFGKRTRCAQTPFSGRKGSPTPEQIEPLRVDLVGIVLTKMGWWL